MAKKFKLLTTVNSVEVSLCSKYNSGANKQTEFEIVKDKETTTNRDVKPVLKELRKYSESLVAEKETEEYDEIARFNEFIDYWLEYDVNNALYNLLSNALQQAMIDIQYEDCTKEEKEQKYINLFNMFLTEYRNFPITKTKEGKYEVSLVSKSLTKESDANPQNETSEITKETTSEMENEQLNVVQKAIEMLKNAFSLEKSETPAEEQPEVETEAKTEEVIEEVTEEVKEEEPVAEEVKEPVEEAEVEQPAEEAEVEAPVVEEEVKEEAVEETVEKAEEVVEEVAEEVEAPVEEAEVEEVSKATEEVDVEALMKAKMDAEKELAELKKANELKEIEIEKMSFVQKAKDEYSMLVGTPEEIGEKLYNITKSNLGEEVKSFVLEQLKKVAVENAELTEEVGSITKASGDMTEEEMLYAKAEELAKSKNISLNKALREIQ